MSVPKGGLHLYAVFDKYYIRGTLIRDTSDKTWALKPKYSNAEHKHF